MYLTWIGRLSTPIRKESSTDARLIIAAAVCDGLDGHVARRWSYLGWSYGPWVFVAIWEVFDAPVEINIPNQVTSCKTEGYVFLTIQSASYKWDIEFLSRDCWKLHLLFWLKTRENSKAINSSTKIGPMSVGKSWNIVKITILVTWCCLVFFCWFMEENSTHWTFIITSDGIQVLPDSDWIWSSSNKIKTQKKVPC